MSWELSLVFKATVLLGVALAAVAVSARMRASRRHLIVASAFAALVALPLAAVLVPSVAVPLPVATPAATPQDTPSSLTAFAMVPASPTSRPGAPRIASTWAPSPVMVLWGVWSFGAVALLFTLGGSLWSLHRLRQSGMPWVAGQAVADALTEEVGLNRTATVTLHEGAAVPATMGVLRPMILLPPDAPQWSEADLRRVLIHELEHVRRGDWWMHLLARAVCTVYWFHPLVWMAWRRLAVLAERACDDAVVARMDRADYAEQLVTLAARLSTSSRLMLSMATRSDLAMRVGAILNPGQQRGRAGVCAAATIFGFVALFVGSVASLQAVAREQDADDARTTPTQALASETAGRRNAKHLVVPTTAGLDVPEPIDQSRVEQPRTTQPATASLEAPGALVQSTSPAPSSAATADVATEPYVIGLGDVVTIVFWGDKDSTGEMVVPPDGKISLPLIGEVQAAGLTPEQLRQVVTAAQARFVTDPKVAVQIKEINSRKVFVVGEVANPGIYPLIGSMTVLQLLAAAGGMNEFARKDAVVISRRVDGRSINIPFDYAAFVSGQQLEQNIILRPGDTVVVR